MEDHLNLGFTSDRPYNLPSHSIYLQPMPEEKLHQTAMPPPQHHRTAKPASHYSQPAAARQNL
jgi:hypothetical protein